MSLCSHPFGAFILAACLTVTTELIAAEPGKAQRPAYLDRVKAYAEAMLRDGHDTYCTEPSPLFAAALDRKTLKTGGALTQNPFRRPHDLLLNLAVGGDAGGNPTDTPFPSRFEIDCVRVCQKQATVPPLFNRDGSP